MRNKTAHVIQPEDLDSRECLTLTFNLNQTFPKALANARYTLGKHKTQS